MLLLETPSFGSCGLGFEILSRKPVWVSEIR